MKISRDGEHIRSMEDWLRIAPPKGKDAQWVDGRSAKELARAWFPEPGDPVVPGELSEMLASCDDIGDVEFHEGWPECPVALDDFPGETRNADLLLTGLCNFGPVIVSVEAKADEELGPTLAKQLSSAKSDASRIPERVENLCHGLFGRPYDADPKLDDLRYQLLTGSAGALIEALNHQAVAAVFCIHEFIGAATDDLKLRRNEGDIGAFIEHLSSGEHRELKPGQVLGPFRARGSGLSRRMSLYMGRAVRRV